MLSCGRSIPTKKDILIENCKSGNITHNEALQMIHMQPLSYVIIRYIFGELAKNMMFCLTQAIEGSNGFE